MVREGGDQGGVGLGDVAGTAHFEDEVATGLEKGVEGLEDGDGGGFGGMGSGGGGGRGAGRGEDPV